MQTHYCKYLLLAALSIVLVACSGSNKPGNAQLSETMQSQMPAYWKLKNLRVESQENLGTETSPRIASRFKATLAPSEDLYTPARTMPDLPSRPVFSVIFIERSLKKDEGIDTYGVMSSTRKGEGWETRINLESDSPTTFGKPQSQYRGDADRVIVVGSKEEESLRNELVEAQERKKQDEEARVEKARQDLLSRIEGTGRFTGVLRQGYRDSYMIELELTRGGGSDSVTGWIDFPELGKKKSLQGTVIAEGSDQFVLRLVETGVISQTPGSTALEGIRYGLSIDPENAKGLIGPWNQGRYSGVVQIRRTN